MTQNPGEQSVSYFSLTAKEKLEQLAYINDEGLVRWKSNNHIPPLDILEQAIIDGYPGIDLEYCIEVSEIELVEFLLAQRDTGPVSEETIASSRAVHGEGVNMVNIVTGQKWRT